MTDDTVLALEERRLVDQKNVVNKLAIKWLETIARANVVRIHGGEFAAGLNYVHGAQSLAESEVLLKRQAMPIRHFQSDEAGVVVAVAHARVDRDAGCQLSICAESGAGDRAVQHGASEIKSASLRCTAGCIALVQVAPQAPDILYAEVS